MLLLLVIPPDGVYLVDAVLREWIKVAECTFFILININANPMQDQIPYTLSCPTWVLLPILRTPGSSNFELRSEEVHTLYVWYICIASWALEYVTIRKYFSCTMHLLISFASLTHSFFSIAFCMIAAYQSTERYTSCRRYGGVCWIHQDTSVCREHGDKRKYAPMSRGSSSATRVPVSSFVDPMLHCRWNMLR